MWLLKPLPRNHAASRAKVTSSSRGDSNQDYLDADGGVGRCLYIKIEDFYSVVRCVAYSLKFAAKLPSSHPWNSEIGIIGSGPFQMMVQKGNGKQNGSLSLF